MARFHVNPDTGKAGACSASRGNCPFASDNEHYSSAEEAREAFETTMTGQAIPAGAKRAVEVETQVPEPTYEQVIKTIDAKSLAKGDLVRINGIMREVRGVKLGYKYASVVASDARKGERQFNLPLEDSVEASVRTETEKSVKARMAFEEERYFERVVKRYEPHRDKAASAINEKIAKGYALGGSEISALVEGEAKDAVMARYRGMVEQVKVHEPDQIFPYKRAHQLFKEELQDRVLSNASRSNSVSTNEAYNLFDRATLSAEADFVKSGPSWF